MITAISDVMTWKVESRKPTHLVAWAKGEVQRIVFARYTALGIVLVTAYPDDDQTKCEVVLNGRQYVCWYDTTAATTRMAALLVNRFFEELGMPV